MLQKQQPDWHGFIPSAWDTKIMSSYCDENFSNGLKQNSKRYLGYEQEDYKTVTTLSAASLDDLPAGGRIVGTETEYEPGDKKKQHPIITRVTKQYRMNELTARHVFNYGCDDTICTAALYNFYTIQMELEDTMGVYEEVEIKPAYLTAQAFIQGVKVSIQRMKEIEKEDDAKFEQARADLAKVLNEAGLIDQIWEPYADNRCADFKDAFMQLFDYKIESKVRTHSKLAADIRNDGNINVEDPAVAAFIEAVEREDIEYCNTLLREKFKKDPLIDMNSPKQMRKFLYEVLQLPVRVINDPTELEWKEKREMCETLRDFKKLAMKGTFMEPTDAQRLHLIAKAKTDDTAVSMALLYDCEEHPVAKGVLEAMQTMKSILTRRSLYYNKYPNLTHWKDGKIHSSMNQSAAVTRRYSSSGPNLQQLPKKGEGVKVREIILPHHRDAVVVSLDYSSQELRLMAHCSQDENMLACYIGDNKKDIHSITAAGAMEMRWGKKKVAELIERIQWSDPIEDDEDRYRLFYAFREAEDKEISKLAADLRKNSKNVNFLAQYDGQALTLSYDLLMPVSVCQEFLDAKYAMFPKVETWKEGIRDKVSACGYALTLMGARRHLANFIFDRATASKAGRQGPNFIIQGSSAEQTKLGMARVWDSGVTYDYDCRFYAPIHDELVFSVHKDQVYEVVKIIHACMTAQYADMTVPCVSEISFGPNFGVQYEVGAEPNLEEINKALKKIFHKELEAA